jgi:outer membrane protein
MRFCAFMGVGVFLIVSPAIASSIGAVDQSIGAGQFFVALEQASELAADDPENRWMTDYVGAHVMLSRGDSESAKTTARRLMAARPADFRVRHLLINTLIATGDYRAAVFHIRLNLEASSDPTVQEQYRALLTKYEEVHPAMGFSMALGANPSSNITRGSGQKTIIINGLPFQVDKAAREQAGGTVTVGFTGFRKFTTGERTEIVASGAINLETAVSDGARDVQTIAPGLQFVRYFDRLILSAGPIAEFQFLDYEPYAKRFGVSAAASRQLTQQTSLTLTSRFVSQDYDDVDYLDGYEAKGALSLRHRFNPSITATATLYYEHEETEADHLSFDEIGTKLVLEKQWENGFYTDVSVSFSTKGYDGDFPLALEPRDDERYEFQVGMAHSALSIYGVMPYVGYRYARNRSNISLYDYEANDIVISGRKQF